MSLSPADKLLGSLGIKEPAEIDIEAIALTQRAKVRYRRLDGCEAKIQGVRDCAVITVREDRRWHRKRFSVGHELGHWEHHRGKEFRCRPEDIGSSQEYSPHDPERVADRYAADLLMPRFMFEPRANQASKMTLDVAADLSNEFDVSLTASAIRLIEFGPAPAMLVCFSSEGRWFRRHKEVPENFFPVKQLDADSYAKDVWDGRIDKSKASLVGAGAWIDRWNADRYEVIEQTYRIARDAILTMVWWKDEAQIEDAIR